MEKIKQLLLCFRRLLTLRRFGFNVDNFTAIDFKVSLYFVSSTTFSQTDNLSNIYKTEISVNSVLLHVFRKDHCYFLNFV